MMETNFNQRPLASKDQTPIFVSPMSVGNIALDGHDIATLNPGEMLNDAVIDGYLLAMADASPTSIVTDSAFM